MTMSDMMKYYLKFHIPREEYGERLAKYQGALLAKMKPGVLEAVGMEQLSDNDPRKQAVVALFDKIQQIVATPYPSYEAFQQALAPYLKQAEKITGPRSDGVGLFTPPSLFHVVATGKHPGGLLELDYVGHGYHYSMVKE